MKITKAFLESKHACEKGMEYVTGMNLLDKQHGYFLEKLVEAGKLDYALWLLPRIMKRKQVLAYAIFAAEQVIEIFEKKHPDDKRPRAAIDAAKVVLKRNTKANRDKARAAAAYAAAAAAAHADAADADAAVDAAAAAAAYADAAAADAAAADAAYAAYYAAYAAAAYYAAAAAYAYAAAKKEMQSRIINFGISLLK